jgi:hypothetical protein
VNQRVLVDRYCDDVADFIGMIRDRIHEFVHWRSAAGVPRGAGKAQATLADSAGRLEKSWTRWSRLAPTACRPHRSTMRR